MPDSPDREAPDAARASSLAAWRLALAALEAEKARLVAKYDQRIADLRQAIKGLERGPSRKPRPTRSSQASPPKPARRGKPVG